MATMIRVRCGPARDLTHVVARNDCIGVRPADAARRLGRDATRPHVAKAAAHAVLGEGALVALRLHPPVASIHAIHRRLVQHLDGRRITDTVFRLPCSNGIFGWSCRLAHRRIPDMVKGFIAHVLAALRPPLSLTEGVAKVCATLTSIVEYG